MGSVAVFKGKLVKFLAKAGILVPARGDVDRSGTPAAGEMAFNTTANKLEVYDGTGWTQLGGGSGNGLVHPTTGSTFELNANNLAMTGTDNTAIGVDSGKFITSGSYNVSIGKESLRNCNTGESNTTVGYGAGRSISIGSRNTLVGNSSGYSSTNQESNTYIGDNSGVVSSGSFNTGLGANSFRYSTQVQYSTAVGYQSLARLSASGSGYYNIGIGYDSGWRLTGGQYNTFIASTGGTSDIVADGCVAIGTDGFGNSSQLNNGDFNAFVLGTVNHRYRLPGRVGTVVQIGPNGTSAGQTGTLRLFELQANGTNSISVRAPDEIATDVTLTLPATAGSANQVLTTDGTGTLSWATPSGGGSTYSLQSLTGTQTLTNWVNRLTPLHTKNVNAAQGAVAFTNSIGTSSAYAGAVYSPIQNRIYFVPLNIANAAGKNWHYVDCSTGNVVTYVHTLTTVPVSQAYRGGVYSPTQNRIYFVPYAQANQTSWHYVNCASGQIVEYAHGVTAVANGYRGGVYSPTQDRIYLIPYNQANQTNWHYIDCSTGNVVAYAHGTGITQTAAYSGGVYSPTENRIYLVPYGRGTQTTWHYIDCSNGNVVSYTHGATVSTFPYNGGAFSPTENRIYLAPEGQSGQANWHYIDCSNGNVVAYARPNFINNGAYVGAVYMPTVNRIYFVPNGQGNNANWHYINCTTSTPTVYTHNVTAVASAYEGGAYSPTENRIYFAPLSQGNQSFNHFIGSTAKADIEPHELGSTIISSTL